jgi:hypothetical protein
MPDADPATNQQPVWTRLLEKLVLTAADHARLAAERGFSDRTIKELQFRTSQAQNRPLIQSLAEEFPPAALEHLGILIKGDDGYFPNGIFCGWGATGNYARNEDGSFKTDSRGRKRRERRQGVNPILIPYLDAGGKPETIRPHKDNIRKADDIDDLDEDYTGLFVYCAHLLRTVAASPLYNSDLHRTFCVITEGEFKGGALWQCGIPALAMPGIQSLRNVAFRRRLVGLLKECGITDVIVCFDNEIKDDPSLPNYKPDEWDRVDTIVYARYTANTLYSEGIRSTRIASLPDEWRIKGKADWDSALATFVRDAGDHEKGTERARREFLKVLKAAKHERDCRDLFASTLHRIIEAKLARLYHSPKVPIGGDEEKRLGYRIRKLDTIPGQIDHRMRLGSGFLDVHGVHYIRKPVKPRGWPDEEMQMIARERDLAKSTQDWATKRYYDELLAGIPTAVSNFAARCKYRLISAEGNIEYLLHVRNVHNESTEQHVRISAEELFSRSGFHKWAIAKVRGSWAAGEKDTQALMMDFQATSAFREIHEIDTYGYSDTCNLWKFANVAFTPEGKELRPDKDLVFWYNGIGYQTDFDKSRIGEGFSQGAPTLPEKLSIDDAIASFILLGNHLFNALGDFAGWLAIGGVISYCVHPEIFRTYMGAPGIWFTGRRGGGKSTIAEWLIQIWGFTPKLNISLGPNTTFTSIGRELAKYSCLPLPMDEFDAILTDPRVQEMLKNAFTRLAGRKATFDGTKQTRGIKPETTPFVLGENSSRNSATRSRYLNISVLDEKSIGDKKQRLLEMNENAHRFPHIGYFVMRNRPKFAEMVMDSLHAWVDDAVVARFVPRIRDRFISGLPYAAFMALARMLRELATTDEQRVELDTFISNDIAFKTFAMEHGSESQKEITETSFANQFWQDVLNLLQIGVQNANYKKLFALKYATFDNDGRISDSDREKFEDSTPVMFMAYETAFLIYEQEIRKAGRVPRLAILDLAREMKREKYWVRPKKDESHKMSIDGVGRPVCWVFNLIEHPFGEEFIDALTARKQATADHSNGQP